MFLHETKKKRRSASRTKILIVKIDDYLRNLTQHRALLGHYGNYVKNSTVMFRNSLRDLSIDDRECSSFCDVE